MVPKLALDVLSCEVMRVLQLTDSFIVPINYHVPRKVQYLSGYCNSRSICHFDAMATVISLYLFLN